jgi:hypothetical protein
MYKNIKSMLPSTPKTKLFYLILGFLAIPSLAIAANWAPENHEDSISCGPLQCTAIQACQKTYRGNLPGLGPDEECLAGDCDTYEKVLYSCIDPPSMTPCAENGCNPAYGPDAMAGFLGSLGIPGLSNLPGLAGIIRSVGFPGLAGIIGGLGIPGLSDLPGLGSVLSFEDLLEVLGVAEPSAIYYNEAHSIEDSPALPVNIYDPLPLPVDIFNPLPLPVNIVAPTPTPVVIVDDLPMYQQDKLINQALADLQKGQTTGNVTDEIREQLTEAELPVLHPFEPIVSAYDMLLDERTSPFLKMINIFGASPNFNDGVITFMEQLSNILIENPEFASVRPIDYDRLCGGLLADAGTLGLGCVLEAMDDNNSQPQVMNTVNETISLYAQMASSLNENLVEQGEGFYPMTTLSDDPAEENPFLALITTPGTNVRAIMDKVMEMNIIDAMESQDCWSALPDNIFDGTLTPMFKEGLFYIFQGDNGGGDILQALLGLLLGNIYESLSCEVSTELSGIFELILGAIGDNGASIGPGIPPGAVIMN